MVVAAVAVLLTDWTTVEIGLASVRATMDQMNEVCVASPKSKVTAPTTRKAVMRRAPPSKVTVLTWLQVSPLPDAVGGAAPAPAADSTKATTGRFAVGAMDAVATDEPSVVLEPEVSSVVVMWCWRWCTGARPRARARSRWCPPGASRQRATAAGRCRPRALRARRAAAPCWPMWSWPARGEG